MKALVLLSGGQDSTTCLWWAIARHGRENVHALTIHYGQRHAAEVAAAARIAVMAGIASHQIIELPNILGSGSALVDKELELKADGGIADAFSHDGLPTSFVPGRNLVFLAIAAVRAVAIGAGVVVTGVCQTDYSGYPDCREAFINAMQRAINEAMPSSVKIDLQAPLMFKTKGETVELAGSLGATLHESGPVWRTIAASVTCYHGKNPGCGECPACVLRATGFARVNVIDPQYTT